MIWALVGAAVLALVATSLLTLGSSPSGADEAAEPISAEPSTPRHAFPWQIHPGPVLATVAEGAQLDGRCDIER